MGYRYNFEKGDKAYLVNELLEANSEIRGFLVESKKTTLELTGSIDLCDTCYYVLRGTLKDDKGNTATAIILEYIETDIDTDDIRMDQYLKFIDSSYKLADSEVKPFFKKELEKIIEILELDIDVVIGENYINNYLEGYWEYVNKDKINL